MNKLYSDLSFILFLGVSEFFNLFLRLRNKEGEVEWDALGNCGVCFFLMRYTSNPE